MEHHDVLYFLNCYAWHVSAIGFFFISCTNVQELINVCTDYCNGDLIVNTETLTGQLSTNLLVTLIVCFVLLASLDGIVAKEYMSCLQSSALRFSHSYVLRVDNWTFSSFLLIEVCLVFIIVHFFNL